MIINIRIVFFCLVLFCPVAVGNGLDIAKTALQRGDYGTAMRAALPVANDENAEAQAFVGYLYEVGLGVKQSYSDALAWYQRAGDNGSTKAQHNLGMLYFNGMGVEQDHVAAYQWFLKAANQDLPASLYMVGLMYHEGYGVIMDWESARLWFLKSAKTGYANAQFMFAFMLQAGEGGVSEPLKAMVWALIAEKNGKEDAFAITIPAGMTLTEAEIETAKETAKICFDSNYLSCPE